MKILGFDIETYKEHFTWVGYMYDGDTREILSKTTVTDDGKYMTRKEFSIIERLFDEADYIVSFNGKKFDLPVLAQIKRALSRTTTIPVAYIYRDAQDLISYDIHNNRLAKKIPPIVREWSAKHFDLLNNCLLRHSLKQWEMYFGLKIRELPYEPSASLTDEMKKEIDEYCAYDVYAMMVIFWASGYDGVGPSGNKGVLNTLPAQKALLEWWPDDLPFTFDRTSQSIGAGVLYDTLKPIPPKTNQPMALFDINSFAVPIEVKAIIAALAKDIKTEFDTTYKGIQYGKGGAHFIREGHYRNLFVADFASLYPCILNHFRLLKTGAANDKYREITLARLEYKKHKKENLYWYNLDRGAKLLLNSPTGGLRMRAGYSPMFDPAAGDAMCYIGQLIITELVAALPDFERLIEVNTDSVFVLGDENIAVCRKMVAFFKEKYDLNLEEEIIDQIYIRDVNTYIIYDSDGNVLSGKGAPYSDAKNKRSNVAVYDILFRALIQPMLSEVPWTSYTWRDYIVKYHKSAASKYAYIGEEPMRYKNYYFMWTTRDCPSAKPISFSRDMVDRKNGAIKARYGVWSQDVAELEQYKGYLDYEQYRRDLDVELALWGRPDLTTTFLTKEQRKNKTLQASIAGLYL